MPAELTQNNKSRSTKRILPLKIIKGTPRFLIKIREDQQTFQGKFQG